MEHLLLMLLLGHLDKGGVTDWAHRACDPMSGAGSYVRMLMG